jgi:hypothetical protein
MAAARRKTVNLTADQTDNGTCVTIWYDRSARTLMCSVNLNITDDNGAARTDTWSGPLNEALSGVSLSGVVARLVDIRDYAMTQLGYV